ncbi:MAG: aspartate aminotransferase family protein [Alphaproteobacteria bacterium]|nr:aspartate aminotransferase family protein [Alphaproteobacteria bacterium]MDE2494087.1 aspartate aminotransferase family protein [Alphaproteobacteria bacterium]
MVSRTANSLDAFWMPFTGNRAFKQQPRMLLSADGMYYRTADGREVIDGISGLWCCNAGHNRPRIVEAIRKQAGELDYSPAFQVGHHRAFELANRLVKLMPGKLNHVFFTNSGSESVETALKIALAYHRIRGEGGRVRLIGREKGYHGVNFGGTAVGGMVANRKMFGALVAGVDHLRHTHGIAENRFARGEPEYGADYADDLERLCQLHDPSTIAAVIVEPVAGSAGVIIPPKGYLKRLREICDRHGILLIFDEVITGYGRLGKPFAVEHFGVEPDIVTTAKGLTNGVIPMGAVFVQSKIYDAFMQGPPTAIELFHGYTYSGNPMACAAALGTLDTYEADGLLTRASTLAGYFEDAVHSLRDLPLVVDVRNLGFIGGVELESIPGEPAKRGFAAYVKAFEMGLLARTTGDTFALAPALIAEKKHIDIMVDTLRRVITAID